MYVNEGHLLVNNMKLIESAMLKAIGGFIFELRSFLNVHCKSWIEVGIGNLIFQAREMKNYLSGALGAASPTRSRSNRVGECFRCSREDAFRNGNALKGLLLLSFIDDELADLIYEGFIRRLDICVQNYFVINVYTSISN